VRIISGSTTSCPTMGPRSRMSSAWSYRKPLGHHLARRSLASGGRPARSPAVILLWAERDSARSGTPSPAFPDSARPRGGRRRSTASRPRADGHPGHGAPRSRQLQPPRRNSGRIPLSRQGPPRRSRWQEEPTNRSGKTRQYKESTEPLAVPCADEQQVVHWGSTVGCPPALNFRRTRDEGHHSVGIRRRRQTSCTTLEEL
jgi:hypothetical protein